MGEKLAENQLSGQKIDGQYLVFLFYIFFVLILFFVSLILMMTKWPDLTMEIIEND